MAGALDTDIRLTLPARPANVAVVRHVLGARSLIAAPADSLEIERSAAAGSRLIMSFLRTRTTPTMGFA